MGILSKLERAVGLKSKRRRTRKAKAHRKHHHKLPRRNKNGRFTKR